MDLLSRKAAGLRTVVAAVVGICALMVSAPSAHAYTYSTCGQWASWSSGSYTVFNDMWNPNGGSQCLNINNAGSWNIRSNFWGGGVKSYGNVSFKPYTSIYGYSIWAYFNCSTPGGSAYDNSFDCWTNDGSEIMIWENWANCSPAGGVKRYNVGIAGASWNVWQGWVGHNCVSFTRNGQRWSGTEYPTQLILWAHNNGFLSGTTINQVQMGFEVTSTSGTQQFTMNSYNAGW
jgi:hypothetical protein